MSKKLIAITLAVLLMLGYVPEVYAFEGAQHFEFESSVTDNLHRGLVGFEGDYALSNDDNPVDIIVVFAHSPAGVLVEEAEAQGFSLSLNQAERIVDDEYTLFLQELSELFGTGGIARASNAYTINQRYRRAVSGVSMTLPANMVADVANFVSVMAIFPDEPIEMPEIPLASISALVDDPFGMSQGRNRMNVHELHQRGYRGEGIVIAVIDSGIDWMHPAFTGTFPTIAEMQLRNPAITNDHGVNIDGTYYFVGRDFIRLWPGGGGADARGNPTLLPPGEPGNDPMEFSPLHFPDRTVVVDNAGNFVNYTSHGTHVAGTIVGQAVPIGLDIETGEPEWDMQNAILGVAPEARVFHYRSLFGSTPTSVIMASLEYTYYDRPDVVNMSLGGGLSTPTAIQNIAINNLMLQNPNKVFVISSGNVGPNFYTGGNPGATSMAITISALTEQSTLVNAEFRGENIDTLAFSVMGNPFAEWIVRSDGKFDNSFNRLSDDDGVYRIFALPHCGALGATGTEDMDLGAAAGPFLVESFVELFMYYGPEVLEGAFILAKRPTDSNLALENAPLIAFNPAMIGAPANIFDVIGGVIFVDGTAPNRTQPRNLFNQANLVPTLMVDNASGRTLLENIQASENGYATFSLSGELVEQIVANFSSRGPNWSSFEIKPDVGAHGMNVFSAVPRWAIGGANANNPHWESLPWNSAYDFRSGSSMSTPHAAGGVALMIQYSQTNGTRWDSQEIKSRIMNTAVDLTYAGNNYGVFDGARQMDVWAAVQADSVVSVNYPYVATVFGLPFEQQPFETVRTGSFSFGGFNLHNNNDVFAKSLTATISNRSAQTRTYTIHHEFITTGRNSLHGATLSHPTTITVAAHSNADFDAMLTIPANTVLGHHEGFVVVSHDGNAVARLPFAGVAVYMPPTLSNVMTYRPVISTGHYAKSEASSELVISLTPNFGFSTNLHLIRAVDGIDAHNWDSAAFEHAVLGTVAESIFFPINQIQPGVPLDRVIFDGSYIPKGSAEPVMLTDEGDYYIVMEVWRQSPNALNTWAWEHNILIPFFVNNTLPEIVIGSKEETQAGTFIVSGNITDALGRGHNALFALHSTDGNGGEVFAERIPLQEDGSFIVTIPHDANTLTLYAVDEYLPVPKALVKGANTHFPIRLEQTECARYYYVGNNVAVSSISLYSSAPVPSFDIFNNGETGTASRPNQHLANGGTIRMWTQLDGINTPVYFAATDTIKAFDQDGNCAMAFIIANRMWEQGQGFLDFFNRVDVNRNGDWQYINFSITIYGQTIEVLLANDRGFHTRVYDEDWRETINVWFFQGLPIYTNGIEVDLNDIVAIVDGLHVNISDFTVNIASWQTATYALMIDKGLPWQEMTVTITVHGQSIVYTFENNMYSGHYTQSYH